MSKFKIGDIVARKSYNYDVLFRITNIHPNGIVDLVMYINTVISKVFSKEEQSRIQVLNFFADEKDIINKELDLILDKKNKRDRGVVIKIGDKCFIIGLNVLFKEFSNNEWKEIVNENKIFVRPKFNVILLDYLKKNKKNKIITIATHIKEDIESLCDEIIEIKNGTIVK